jgi:serine/threonine protein kinase
MPGRGDIRLALEQLQKFTIHQEIDEGANAFAFRAFDRLLEREIFLKVTSYSPESASELLREPRVLVQATQGIPTPENLVQVFGADVITVAGEQYLSLQMEWIEGASLSSNLATKNIGQLDALRIARGVLHGLSHLHMRRILHRDLKPANILLSGNIPKIADFGSVALLPAGATTVSASRHSALYVPPEAWKDPPYYAVSSDIYQVGMVLYELINGPFEYELRHYLTPKILRQLRDAGRNYEALDDYDKSKHADRGIAELCSRDQLLVHGRPPRPYYSKKLRRVVNGATKAKPNERFSTAAEFISKLNKLDVPNWQPVDGSEFLAENWKDWDWMVSSTASTCLVRKAKVGTNRFRKIPNRVFARLTDAFSYVDEQ